MALSRLLQRRGTASQWAVTNPVLESGELGVETDTKKIKLGDGRTAWNTLAYAGGLIPGDQGVVGDLGPAGPGGPLGSVGPKGPVGDIGTNGLPGSATALSPIQYNPETFSLSLLEDQVQISSDKITSPTSSKSSTYTLLASDANSFIGSSEVPLSITVPDVLQDGQIVTFIQTGAEKISFSGQGITLNTKALIPRTKMQYAGASVAKVNGGYFLFGDLE